MKKIQKGRVGLQPGWLEKKTPLGKKKTPNASRKIPMMVGKVENAGLGGKRGEGTDLKVQSKGERAEGVR